MTRTRVFSVRRLICGGSGAAHDGWLVRRATTCWLTAVVVLAVGWVVAPSGWAQDDQAETPAPAVPCPADEAELSRADRMRRDQTTFQYLLAHHEQIERHVTMVDNGVSTTTETDDPEVRGRLREHVAAMQWRIEQGVPIRRRDPLFRVLFDQAGQIEMRCTETERGVQVEETSDDPWTVRLIQAHAHVVSLFVERGFAEARLNHDPPKRPRDAGSATPSDR